MSGTPIVAILGRALTAAVQPGCNSHDSSTQTACVVPLRGADQGGLHRITGVPDRVGCIHVVCSPSAPLRNGEEVKRMLEIRIVTRTWRFVFKRLRQAPVAGKHTRRPSGR